MDEMKQTDNADARYKAALMFVRHVDRHVTRRTRHYRDTSGRLLVKFDQVLAAALAGTLEASR